MQFALFYESVSLLRIAPEQNMWRYYNLSVQPDLFGGVVLIRHWGRLGTQGVQRYDLFTDAGAAANRLARICEQKRRKGYVFRDFSSVRQR